MTTTSTPILWRGLEFETDDEDVYAPKPASLLLAEQAIERVRPGERVLDACTGSGVVGISIAKFVPGSRVTVSDINDAALASAKRNAARNAVDVRLAPSNLYKDFADAEFDVVTVHPPAVPYPDDSTWGLSAGMQVATDGGSDGSNLVVRSIAEARRVLRKGGRLLLLLPHWSNVEKARQTLRGHYSDVAELARKSVEFFPVREGKPSEKLLAHVRQLAAAGVIEMTFEGAFPLSTVSVIEARVP